MNKVTPIPKTRKTAKSKKASAPKEEIPQDLANAWAAVVAIATTHKLLQDGHFQWKHKNAVGSSIAFMEELHGNAISDCHAHPKSHLIPEIAQTYASRKAQENEQQKQAQAQQPAAAPAN